MSQKATEDTISSLLRDEIIKHDLQVELFPSLQTPNGYEKKDRKKQV